MRKLSSQVQQGGSGPFDTSAVCWVCAGMLGERGLELVVIRDVTEQGIGVLTETVAGRPQRLQTHCVKSCLRGTL
jgi:hypothetical protein